MDTTSVEDIAEGPDTTVRLYKFRLCNKYLQGIELLARNLALFRP